METRDDLWIGVAAIETGWLGADQLFSAWQVWQQDRQATLGEVLVQGQYLSAEQWQWLVQRARSSRESGQPGAVARSAAAAPVSNGSQPDHDDSTLVSGPESGAGVRRGSPLFDSQDASGQRSRYTLSHLHGRGGLGVVWVATDPQLNREVALKELREDRTADRIALARMVREARITGQLEHPNIVPVYELQPGAPGRSPYYTMRLLRGKTLRAAIKEYYRQPREERDGLGLRLLLDAFVGVCHAVAYAGSKHVVHRDLKPQNIMLGPFGEVVVLDWGLARVLDIPQDEADATPPVVGSGGAQTLDGQVVGTPAYLSPEQAAGDLRALDIRTDVYGLGAILFEILTGRPPHRRDVRTTSLTKLLAKIRQEPSPEVRQFNVAVAAPLNAICRKAMAHAKQDRYATAQELADDVQRWMADEPVSVYPDSVVESVFRWLRHHRTMAMAAAGSLLLVAAVSTLAAFLVHHAWRNEATARMGEQAALRAEQSARREAVARFLDARRAVDRSLTGVAAVLEFFPGVQQLRSELLRAALEDYQRFAEQRSDDLELQRETARAMVRLGDVQGLLQQWEAAEQSYAQAGEFLRQLLQTARQDADICCQLAHCQKQQAFAAATLGRHEQAERLFRAALQEAAGPLDAEPDSAEYLATRGTILIDQAQWLSARGDAAAALEALKQAEADFDRLYKQHKQPEFLRGLAAARRLTGQVYQTQGELPAAEGKLQEALSDLLTLHWGHNDQPDYLKDLADCRINLANTLADAGRSGEAEQYYLAAGADYQSLLKARPDVPPYLENLALTQHNLALQYYREGDAAAASEQALAALEIFVYLVNEHPENIRYHAEHAATSLTAGQILRELNQQDDASLALGTAQRKYEELSAQDQAYSVNLAISWTSQGLLLHQQGDLPAAESKIRQAVELLAARVADSPENHTAADSLAWAHQRLADVLLDADRSEDAASCYAHCRERRELLSRPQDQYCLAWFLLQCRSIASRDPQRALEIAQRLIQQAPTNPSYRTLLGAAQFRSGQLPAAIITLQLAQRLRDRPNAADAVYLALVYHASQRPAEARDQLAAAQEIWERTQPGNADLKQLFLEAGRAIGPEENAAPDAAAAQAEENPN